MKIDRCVCYQKPFSLLKEVADSERCSSIEDLQKEIRFGEQCKMCHPYVQRMLDTGEVEFSEVIVNVRV